MTGHWATKASRCAIPSVAQVTLNFKDDYVRNVSVHHTLMHTGPGRVPVIDDPSLQPKAPTMVIRVSELILKQWTKLSWSDECRFLLHHVDGCVHVCRLPGEMMAAGCTVGQ